MVKKVILLTNEAPRVMYSENSCNPVRLVQDYKYHYLGIHYQITNHLIY